MKQLTAKDHATLSSLMAEIIAAAPASASTEEDYDDTESAFNNGHDCAAWEAAQRAKRAARILQRAR